MPTLGSYGPTPAQARQVRRDVADHYRRRGVTCPRKLSALTQRWINQKGWRSPA